MSEKLFISFLTLCVLFLAPSCQKDDETDWTEYQESYYSGTFTNQTGSKGGILYLTFDGKDLENKQVEFYTKDNKEGKFTFTGIIPKEDETIISGVKLKEKDEYTLEFDGVYTSTSKKYNYSGYVQRGLLSLDIAEL